MSLEYYHDNVSVDGVISQLRVDLDNYKNEINNLKNLVNEINSSGSWKDEQVKTSFISKAQEYLLVYNGCIASIESYIRYLEGKNNSASGLESAFS